MTPFEEIEEVILVEMGDSRLSTMDIFNAKQLLSTLIINSATVDFHICPKIALGYVPYDTINNIDGYFNADLDAREKYIVGLGASIGYLQQFINDSKNLQVLVGDKDYKLTPNYLVLKGVLDINTEKRNRLNKLVSEYQYEQVTSDILT